MFHLADIHWIALVLCVQMLVTDYIAFGSTTEPQVIWNYAICIVIWVIWLESNAKNFVDKFQVVKMFIGWICYLSSFWTSMTSPFKGIAMFFYF